MYKDVLLRHGRPLVEDGPAPFESHRPGRLQHVGQSLRRLDEVDQNVQCVQSLLIKELKEPDGRPAAIVAVVPATESLLSCFASWRAWLTQQNASRTCVDVDPAHTTARCFYTRHGAESMNEHGLVWNHIRTALATEKLEV